MEETSIIEDLENGSFPGWPEAEWRIYLSEKASEAYRTNTIEGRLFAFLVFQQLAEELLLVAAESYIFELRCIIFPREIKLKSMRDMSFGQIISYTKEVCPIDEKLNALLDQCEKLNQLRKKLIHKLVEFEDEKKIMQTTEKARFFIRKINDAYDNIADHYRIVVFPKWQSRVEEMKKQLII